MTDHSASRELAAQPQQSSRWVAGTTTALCEIPAATAGEGRAELGACLTLAAPSGLTSDDRREWIAVAMQTLTGIPADLLKRGCEAARKTARFPSEIVPTIMATIGSEWERRKLQRRMREDQRERMSIPTPQPDRVDPAEVAKILAEFGLKGGRA